MLRKRSTYCCRFAGWDFRWRLAAKPITTASWGTASKANMRWVDANKTSPYQLTAVGDRVGFLVGARVGDGVTGALVGFNEVGLWYSAKREWVIQLGDTILLLETNIRLTPVFDRMNVEFPTKRMKAWIDSHFTWVKRNFSRKICVKDLHLPL